MGPNSLDWSEIFSGMLAIYLEMPCNPGRQYYGWKVLGPTLVDHDYQEFGKLGFTQKLNSWLKVGENGRNWQKRRFSGKNSPKIQKQIDYGLFWAQLMANT